MKFPTYKEMGEKVAEQALDEYVINGKTLREWIKLLSEQEPLLPMGKYLKTSFPCDAEDDVKQTKQEPCDDVVSRQAVEDAIYDYSRSCDVSFAQIMEYIDKLPPVRPQEQTGKWEEIVKEHKCYARDDTYTTTEYHCSECGAEPFVNEDGFYELSNYCPNCGAKMVNPQESEEI